MPISVNKPKRVTFLCISLIFFSIRQVWKWLNLLSGRKIQGICVVLYYHDVGTHQARFARQMKKLSRWVTPIDANFTGSLERGKNYASVTFCDGFVCFLAKALPELRKFRIPTTLFVPSGYIGRRPNWIDNKDHTGLPEQQVMNAEQLKSLPSHLITVGSHGVYHRNLVHLTEREAEAELLRSKMDLETILKREVDLFFFPYGEYNKALLELAQKAGYKRVFCNIPRLAFREPNEFLSGAFVTDPTDWGLEFKLKVLGGYSWRPFAISVKRRLLRS